MNTATAALIGVILGATIKHFLDLRAARQTKLLDEKLRYAVAFFAAADWAGRSYREAERAHSELEDAVGRSSDRELIEAEQERARAIEQGHVALKEAHTAACALRLLIPVLAADVSGYLRLVVETEASPQSREEIDGARTVLESRLVSAFETSRPWWHW